MSSNCYFKLLASIFLFFFLVASLLFLGYGDVLLLLTLNCSKLVLVFIACILLLHYFKHFAAFLC